MRLSENGERLIKHYEGCKLQAYQCPAGIWTIGYGNTFYEDGRRVRLGDKITQQQAEEMFKLIYPKFETLANTKIKRDLLQQEYDAAVSFCYNAGVAYRTADKNGNNASYKDYDLWKHINLKLDGVEMEKYWQNLAVTSGGKKLNGLIKRRKSEVELYLTGNLIFY